MIRFIYTLITVAMIILMMIVTLISYIFRHPVKNEMTIKEFEPYSDDFVIVNDYILENSDWVSESKKHNVIVIEENGQCIGLNYDREDANVPEDVLQALNNINEYFGENDFHLIGISDSQIRYWGYDDLAIVYQQNGKAPRYFEHKGDNVWDYSTYILGNDWYRLYNHTHIR